MVKDIKGDLEELLRRRNQRYRDGTAQMEALARDGEFKPPCHWDCTGDVKVEIEKEWVFGRCPMLMKDPCLIPEREREAKIEDLVALGWPRRYLAESSWDECDVEAEVRAIPASAGILFRGPTGTGKTSTAGLIAMARWPTQRWAYAYWRELVQRLGDGGMPKLARARYLVIDDYGVGEIPPWKIGDVDAMWEYRNARSLPTIVTTNLTPEQIKQDASRWADRFRQLMPYVVTISGGSKR